MFLSLDGTAWIQLLNFGVFFLILNVVFLRPVGAALRRRREYIDSVQADYERYAGELENLRREGEAKRAAARRSADELLASARAAAEGEAAKIADGYARSAQAQTADAQHIVAGELAAARSREDELAASLAELLLTRALGAGR
jgi:F0F1-type ATP synthase membrane subunit b/b'